MISLNDRVYGLPLFCWCLIAIVILVFLFTTFSPLSSAEPFESCKSKTDIVSPKVKVFNFNTSWCGWSVRFQPEWKKFENEIKAKGDLSHVEAHDIKCDNPENDFLCKEYEVAGFPTVIIETDGKRGVYKGPREAMELVETIKSI
jgi:hypothetical protein